MNHFMKRTLHDKILIIINFIASFTLIISIFALESEDPIPFFVAGSVSYMWLILFVYANYWRCKR